MIVLDIPWELNTIAFHRGYMITAVQESGRQFWTACVPDKGGWSLRQEFGSVPDAARYIDERTK
jgi:hypothetical protein